jgi:hypothetical protein
MRWTDEVERNVKLVEDWKPPFDLADMPRLTFEVYSAEDTQPPD